MKVEFITTGNEIMSGATVDTNFSWTAEKFLLNGHAISLHTSVGDDPDDLFDAFRNASLRSDFVIVTGGLGPTDDDLTSQTAARLFGVDLGFDETSYRGIEEKLARRGREILEIHRKQASFPEGAEIIKNQIGTSPGFKYQYKSSTYYFLPGIPSEFRQMIDEFVLPDILDKTDSSKRAHIKIFKTIGLGESEVATRVSGAGIQDAELGYRIFFPEVHIRLTVGTDSQESASAAFEKNTGRLRDKLGEYIFTEDDKSLELVVSELLKLNRLTISTAESCTGGLLSNRLTDIPGSSEYFLMGVVTYNNESKMDILEVNENTLLDHGAVSSATVEEMARGIRKLSGSDIGVSVSGIAGPGGGSEEKPVGTVHIGIDFKNEVSAHLFNFHGTRGEIKLISSSYALDLVRKKILNYV